MCVSGLPQQTAKYWPSMEKETDHAGEPFRLEGQRVAIGSKAGDFSSGDAISATRVLLMLISRNGQCEVVSRILMIYRITENTDLRR